MKAPLLPAPDAAAALLVGLDEDGELDRLLEAFCADPSDERTFGQLEVLLRGAGRWEIAEDRSGHSPPHKRV